MIGKSILGKRKINLNWLKSKRRRIVLAVAICFLCFSVITLTAGVYAQQPSPTPGSGNSDSNGLDFRGTLERLTLAAERMIPAFVQTVESPFGGWFDSLAFYLAWLIAIMFFLKMLRANGGTEPEDLFWYLARVAVCFALLLYCGDINHDGVRGDLLNRIGQFGNSVAYGTNQSGNRSFLGRKVQEQKNELNENYDKFVKNAFMVKVNNEDRLIRYPGDDQRGFQMLSALYSKNTSLEQISENLDPKGWDMGSLFWYLNVGRGIVEFGDLFLLLLQGFLIVSLRLAAPFMIAVAIDRDYAKRISINFAWGAIVGVLVLPIISQLIRFFAYGAANVAMKMAPNEPYFRYDPTTAKIVAVSDPVSMIIICAVIMTIAGLCMFASPYISYKLSQGGVFEAISSTVSGWMGGMISTGISTISTAASTALNKQAEQTNAYGQSQADTTSAKGTFQSQNILAAAQASSTIANSRSQAESETRNAWTTGWAGSQRAMAQQDRIVAEQEAGVVAGDINREAEATNAGVTAQKELDDAYINDTIIPGGSTIYGSLDNLNRGTGGTFRNVLGTIVGAVTGNPGNAANPQPATNQPWSVTQGGGMVIPGTERPFVPNQVDHSNGLGYRALDRSTGNKEWDALIDKTGKSLNIDPAFSTEIFRKETGGFQAKYVDGREKSPMGASGIGQFTEGAAKDYGLFIGKRNGKFVDERNDPMKAIPAAMAYHRDLLSSFGGNPLLAAAGYNAGKGAVLAYTPNNPSYNSYVGGSGKTWTVSETTAQRAQGIPQNTETKDYVQTVGTRLGIGTRAQYQTPEGIRQIMAMTTNSRAETRARRDAFVGVENTNRTIMAGAAADRYKADATIQAGQVYTNQEIGINSQEYQYRAAAAQTANAQRIAAAQELYGQTTQANQVVLSAQTQAISIREAAAIKASQERAQAAFISGFGNTLASQTQGVFTQFNRY